MKRALRNLIKLNIENVLPMISSADSDAQKALTASFLYYITDADAFIGNMEAPSKYSELDCAAPGLGKDDGLMAQKTPAVYRRLAPLQSVSHYFSRMYGLNTSRLRQKAARTMMMLRIILITTGHPCSE